MKTYTTLIALIAMSLAACARKEEAPPAQVDETPAAAPAVVEEPAVEPAEVEAAPTLLEGTDLAAFIKHMHEHADKIDDINFALADGNLEGAMTPAYWLSRHDEVAGVPAEWVPFLKGMREGARAVEASGDLEAARTAAKGITENCQGCHVAAGIVES